MPYHTAYPQAPKDRVNLVYWLMCLLGISALLPYNVMLTEAEYYTVRTHQEPTIEILADNFETILVNSYTVGNLLTFLLLVPYGKHLTVNVQMLVPLWTILVVVGSQAAMALVPQLSGKVVIIVTMAGASLLGVVSAMFLSGVYALASWFPPIYTQAVVAGNGMAGLSLSGLSFLTAWRAVRNDTVPTSEEVSLPAFEYFTTAASVVALGLVGYTLLPCIPFVQFWNSPEEYEYLQSDLPRAASWASFGMGGDDLDSPRMAYQPQSPGRNFMKAIRHYLSKRLSRSSSTLSMRLASQVELPLQRMITELKGYNVVAGLCFMVTLFVFPGITASICSIRNPAPTAPCAPVAEGSRFYGDLFTPLTFLIYNLGDFLGRSLAGYQRKPLGTSFLVSYAVCRIGLIPALAFCNVITPHPWLFHPFFRADFFPMAFIFLLGLTNGNLATLVLMHAPSLVSESLRERCGTIMSFSLTCGIMAGSVGSLLIIPQLQHK